MILLLAEVIKRSGGTDLQYFESCYYWKYQKQINCFGDVLAYRVQGIIPNYVKEFLAHVYR